MVKSDLAKVVILSPNCRERTHAIDTITIHHAAAVGVSATALGNLFAQPTRNASANYGIGVDGEIGCFVPEDKRAITSSNGENDNRAITIEVANSGGAPNWPVSSASMSSLILLLTDVCKRNGIKKLLWRADKSLVGQVDRQNMTVHRWFAATACPGDYLMSKMGDIAQAVNRCLGDDDATKEKRYDTIASLPSWAKETVKKLCRMGLIEGHAPQKDLQGYPMYLDLSTDMLRVLVINDRAGLYKEGNL